jgi:hypothetical protein
MIVIGFGLVALARADSQDIVRIRTLESNGTAPPMQRISMLSPAADI